MLSIEDTVWNCKRGRRYQPPSVGRSVKAREPPGRQRVGPLRYMGPPRPAPLPERPPKGKLRTDSTYDWREVGEQATPYAVKDRGNPLKSQEMRPPSERTKGNKSLMRKYFRDFSTPTLLPTANVSTSPRTAPCLSLRALVRRFALLAFVSSFVPTAREAKPLFALARAVA
jgi:hypothetical protein